MSINNYIFILIFFFLIIFNKGIPIITKKQMKKQKIGIKESFGIFFFFIYAHYIIYINSFCFFNNKSSMKNYLNNY